MKVELTDQALKQLLQLPKSEAKKITKKLHLLKTYPYLGKKLKGKLSEKYSLKAWPYRIIYIVIKGKHLIQIEVIELRQGIYK